MAPGEPAFMVTVAFVVLVALLAPKHWHAFCRRVAPIPDIGDWLRVLSLSADDRFVQNVLPTLTDTSYRTGVVEPRLVSQQQLLIPSLHYYMIQLCDVSPRSCIVAWSCAYRNHEYQAHYR